MSTKADLPTMVTPEARGSPSRTTRTSARLPLIVNWVIRPCCSAWINVRGPTVRSPSGRTNGMDVSIATKFGFGINPDGTRYGLDSRPDHIRQVTDAALKRLRIETIDVL